MTSAKVRCGSTASTTGRGSPKPVSMRRNGFDTASAYRSAAIVVPRFLPRSRVGARNGIQRARSSARLLELPERLSAHRGIDVQVRHANDGAPLLEHEEADAVVNHAAPVER